MSAQLVLLEKRILLGTTHLETRTATPSPRAIPAASQDNSLSEKHDAWCWGPHHSSFNLSASRLTATRAGGGPDYAAAIGDTHMTEGIHEWTMKIEQDVDGVWVGVCSPTMPLGRDSNLDSMSPSDAKLWWWRSSGYVWSNTGDFGRRRNV